MENDGYGGILIFVDGAKSCYQLKDSLLNSKLFNDGELLILYSNMEEKFKKDIHKKSNKKRLLFAQIPSKMG